jgi:ParB-like chromosome segregation protein Spo0J
MAKPKIKNDGRTITVRVPISIRKRGGRKVVLTPDGAVVPAGTIVRHTDNAIIKAIARAFRWREMLENGIHATIAEIAAAEKINESYISRVLRLALLAPEIVERIVEGRQPAGLSLEMLLGPLPIAWQDQKRSLVCAC